MTLRDCGEIILGLRHIILMPTTCAACTLVCQADDRECPACRAPLPGFRPCLHGCGRLLRVHDLQCDVCHARQIQGPIPRRAVLCANCGASNGKLCVRHNECRSCGARLQEGVVGEEATGAADAGLGSDEYVVEQRPRLHVCVRLIVRKTVMRASDGRRIGSEHRVGVHLSQRA